MRRRPGSAARYKRTKHEAEATALALRARRVRWVRSSTKRAQMNRALGSKKPTPTGKIIVDFMRGRIPAFVDTGLNVVRVNDVAIGHVLAAGAA